jgi:hypothetical protein
MIWIAPSEKDTATNTLEKRLWDAADQLRANSGLKAQEYSGPILGLIFLRFAEVRFIAQRAKLEKAGASSRRGSRVDEPGAYHAEGILYLPAEARFDYLLNRPEAENIGAKVNAAMRDIEKHNPQLAGVLPKTFNLFTSTLLKELLKKVSEIPATADYDAFGRIYEYFLGEFVRTEGQKGGEFYTPGCIVRLLTEVIEPYHDCLSTAGAESQANKTLPAGSICVSCIGTIGVVSITTEDCQTNQQINSVVLANPASREFLFLRLQDSKQTLENLGANGATMGNVNKGKFEAMEIVCPSDDLLARYHRLVEPMFSEILSLFRQIQNLRRTRDLLLPRLLSGQVELAEREVSA